LLGYVVARKRADTAGTSVYADAPAVVIATHHSDQVTLMQLEFVGVTWFIVVQHAVPAAAMLYNTIILVDTESQRRVCTAACGNPSRSYTKRHLPYGITHV